MTDTVYTDKADHVLECATLDDLVANSDELRAALEVLDTAAELVADEAQEYVLDREPTWAPKVDPADVARWMLARYREEQR